ncbi:type II secretion system protein [Pedosphaera parvula]|uniref:Type II secretory pathway pseudopilin PulG-like protein n=1 Tax=Pedosphaera parvula (strain Ellin514) TaxID=320771 RepID=B9XLB1_PEDPL|nr:type II secretion system protein [Pedosphaera parvula]EEF59314.1 hypothetical protein Cflav_PD1862 [Pedosphaera parvula Ellin514]
MILLKRFELRTKGRQAFTLLELMLVVFIVAVLTASILPMTARPRVRSSGIVCINNLKEVGLAFRTWSEDNGKVYPMHFRTNGFDGEALANSRGMCGYFQIMSNELKTPKVLVCPGDKKRRVAADFRTNFNSGTVSYFVALDSDETKPQTLLAGDRNLTNGLAAKNGVLEITTNSLPGWTMDIHQFSGNVVLADGSVQKVSVSGVKRLIFKTGLATNRIVFPPQ